MNPADLDNLPLGLPEPNVVVTVQVNGRTVTEQVPARLHAADFLRHRLGLTGTHVGCEQGVCGMCTVLVDGEAVKSCLMLAAQLDGRRVETVESLATGEGLSPLQECFKQDHALQCGFCTPGMIMTAKQILERNSNPTEQEIRHGLEGNLCRCTGYQHIVNAVKAAAAKA